MQCERGSINFEQRPRAHKPAACAAGISARPRRRRMPTPPATRALPLAQRLPRHHAMRVENAFELREALDEPINRSQVGYLEENEIKYSIA